MAALEVGLQQSMKNDPDLFEKVHPRSFLEAVVRATHVGLLPDGKQGAIVRFADQAAFLPMVEGFVEIIWKTGLVVEVNHNVVCEGDDFDFEEGDNGFVSHRRSLKRPADAEVIGAWCVIKLTTGGTLIEVCDQATLRQIAKVSRAQKGPRVDWAQEMHRKAPFRRLVKRMPKSERLDQLIRQDDATYDLTATAREPEATAVPRDALFDSRAHHRRRRPREEPRADDAPAPTDAGADTGQAPDEPGAEHDQRQLIEALAVVDGAEGFVELGVARQAAEALCVDDDERRTWVSERVDQRFQALGGKPDDAGNAYADRPKLRAQISSVNGVVEYDEPSFWRSDILTKMDAISGATLAQFWKINAPFLREAVQAGYAVEVDKIVAVARNKGLPDV